LHYYKTRPQKRIGHENRVRTEKIRPIIQPCIFSMVFEIA